MSRHERYGDRDLTYSAWHRTLDDDLHYIDVDAVEYCAACKTRLALIELARDVGQGWKATTVLRGLANDAGLKAWLVLYRIDASGEIDRFRVRRVAPQFGPERLLDPTEFAEALRWLRRQHDCPAQQPQVAA